MRAGKNRLEVADGDRRAVALPAHHRLGRDPHHVDQPAGVEHHLHAHGRPGADPLRRQEFGIVAGDGGKLGSERHRRFRDFERCRFARTRDTTFTTIRVLRFFFSASPVCRRFVGWLFTAAATELILIVIADGYDRGVWRRQRVDHRFILQTLAEPPYSRFRPLPLPSEEAERVGELTALKLELRPVDTHLGGPPNGLANHPHPGFPFRVRLTAEDRMVEELSRDGERAAVGHRAPLENPYPT